MSEFLNAARDIGSVAALLGVPIGALIVAILIIVFVPWLRSLAIAAAVIAGTALVCLGYGDHHGAARVTAERDAADTLAAQQRKANDAGNEQKLTTDFPPAPAVDQVDPDETKILADLSATPVGACQLGADALRLRNRN